MATDSGIEWTHDTSSPWWGCTKKKRPDGRVRRACALCYAERDDARWKRGGTTHWGDDAPRLVQLDTFERQLRKSARKGAEEGRPRRVFVASMADVFEDREDLEEPRARVFELLHELDGQIVPLLLTKRPEVAIRSIRRYGWPRSAWLGLSVEDQAAAEEVLPVVCLDEVLAAHEVPLFLSMEPLVGGLVDLAFGHDLDGFPGVLDALAGSWVPAHGGPPEEELAGAVRANPVRWVIAGGESGPGARPTHPRVFQSLRDQCRAAEVPFFLKQWGEWSPYYGGNPPGRKGRVFDLTSQGLGHFKFWRLGKKLAGATLDDGRSSRTYRELPAGWLP